MELIQNKINASLYSQYYVEVCNVLRGLIFAALAPGLQSYEKTLQRWRYCVRLDKLGIEPQTSAPMVLYLTTTPSDPGAN